MSSHDENREDLDGLDALHALVDGHLADEQRQALLNQIAGQPDTASLVRDWHAQNRALHETFDSVLDEPVPHRLIEAARGRGRQGMGMFGASGAWPGWSIAASVLALASTGLIGYELGRNDPRLPEPVRVAQAAVPGLVRDAALAYAVYAPEQRHPVEVDAKQADHLVTWLSRRLGTPLHAPQLVSQGYELLGGRLLAAGNGPVAQFMYQGPAGRRMTLYVRRTLPAEAAPTLAAFQFAREGDVNVFYWVEGDFGYALSGGMDRGELQSVATVVYQQLTAAEAKGPTPSAR